MLDINLEPFFQIMKDEKMKNYVFCFVYLNNESKSRVHKIVAKYLQRVYEIFVFHTILPTLGIQKYCRRERPC